MTVPLLISLAAAFSITSLYKQGLLQSRRSYQQGYEQCLQDIISFISRNRGDDEMPISVNEVADYLLTKQTDMRSDASLLDVDAPHETPSREASPIHDAAAPESKSDMQEQRPRNTRNSGQQVSANTPPSTTSIHGLFDLRDFTFTPPTSLTFHPIRDRTLKRPSDVDIYPSEHPYKYRKGDDATP